MMRHHPWHLHTGHGRVPPFLGPIAMEAQQPLS